MVAHHVVVDPAVLVFSDLVLYWVRERLALQDLDRFEVFGVWRKAYQAVVVEMNVRDFKEYERNDDHSKLIPYYVYVRKSFHETSSNWVSA